MAVQSTARVGVDAGSCRRYLLTSDQEFYSACIHLPSVSSVGEVVFRFGFRAGRRPMCTWSVCTVKKLYGSNVGHTAH
jgi:hypothetical protein